MAGSQAAAPRTSRSATNAQVNDSPSPTEEFSIINEFGAVHIRKIHTRNGERLEISAPRMGYSVRLDALELEALSWQTEEFFSALLETPLGPEGEAKDEF
jgi:hypothetical protein